VVPVAPDDEVGANVPLAAIVPIGDRWGVGRDIVQLDLLDTGDDHLAPCIGVVIEILLQRRLAVGHEMLTGAGRDVEEQRPSTPRDGRPVVHHPVTIHVVGDARGTKDVDRSPLQHAGANPLEDMLATLALEDHGLHADAVEQRGQQGARRTRAHDRDLRSHRIQYARWRQSCRQSRRPGPARSGRIGGQP
jgi:hypothetical protein